MDWSICFSRLVTLSPLNSLPFVCPLISGSTFVHWSGEAGWMVLSAFQPKSAFEEDKGGFEIKSHFWEQKSCSIGARMKRPLWMERRPVARALNKTLPKKRRILLFWIFVFFWITKKHLQILVGETKRFNELDVFDHLWTNWYFLFTKGCFWQKHNLLFVSVVWAYS